MFSLPDLEYDLPPYRPPNEACSALIRAIRGCPWNRCEFCTMYKDMRFEAKPLEEIYADIDAAVRIFPSATTVFIADSDPLVMKDIASVISRVRKSFPRVRRITTYARARTLRALGKERLGRIHEAGLDRVHVGLESGDDEVLAFMNKGATARDMVEGTHAAREAGLEVSFYVLVGAGGTDRLVKHATASAMVCNEAAPNFIRLRTLIVQRHSPLERKRIAGTYRVTSPMEKLEEVHRFISELEVENCILASDHHTNNIWVDSTLVYRGVSGRLPEDRRKMLASLENAMMYIDSTDGDVMDATILYQRGYMNSL